MFVASDKYFAMRKSFIVAAAAATLAGSSLTACDEDTLDLIFGILNVLTDSGEEVTVQVDDKGLGYLEPDEDTSTIEDDIHLNTNDGDGTVTSDLPSKVDLTAYLPPIGNQGSYGTCVAWATAYNCRTWLDAHKNGRTTNQLTTSEIYSPADIWKGISSSQKNSGCQGTAFQPAFNAMVSRGVATWAKSPYFSSSSDCDCSNSSAENTEAAKHKIKSYREIAITDINTVKRYLAEGHPVVLGACLGDNYMNASGSSVIYSKGTTNQTGMHAYHAMMCVGYDNNRGGSNGAFRIVNSWGEDWGDNGFVWIDANYMCSSSFAYTGLVAYLDDDDTTSYGDESSTVDLQPTKITDEDYYVAGDSDSDDPRWRTLTYDVYNAGNGTVSASSTWGNAYVLYNAYNANEMTVVLVDLYTDQLGVAKNHANFNWDKDEAKATIGLDAQGYSLTNVDIPGLSSVATVVTKATDSSMKADAYNFSWSYKLPDVSGKYYLVLIADAFSSVSESNESNNYYFLTAADNGPLTISNGVIQTSIANNKSLSLAKPKQNAAHPQQTAVNETAPNTYSPAEISKVLDRMRASGELRNKAQQWVEQNEQTPMAKRKVVKVAE